MTDFPKIARRVRYEGRVQGVGFRYTVSELAEKLGVCGTVRNEADGSVLLDAEGAATALAELQVAIRARFGASITTETADEVPLIHADSMKIVRQR